MKNNSFYNSIKKPRIVHSWFFYYSNYSAGGGIVGCVFVFGGLVGCTLVSGGGILEQAANAKSMMRLIKTRIDLKLKNKFILNKLK